MQDSKALRLTTTLSKNNIPSLFATVTIADYESDNDSQRRAAVVAKSYVGHFDSEIGFYGHHGGVPVGLYLYGPVGVGKTHLALAIMKEVIDKEIDTLFIRVTDLLQRLRPPNNDVVLLELVETVDFLVLDDFGMQKDTSWTYEQLTSIVDARLIEELPTIITSNFTLELLAANGIEGERIASRIRQLCEIVLIKGKDYRKVIAGKRKQDIKLVKAV